MAILTDQTTNLPGGLTIGSSGTEVTQIRVYSESLVPTTFAGPSITPQSFTVTGLTTADKLIVNPPVMAVSGNGVNPVGAYCVAANTATILFDNPTTGSLTPRAGTYVIIALRT